MEPELKKYLQKEFKRLATKSDVKVLETRISSIESHIATKNDLNSGLRMLEDKLQHSMDDLVEKVRRLKTKSA